MQQNDIKETILFAETVINEKSTVLLGGTIGNAMDFTAVQNLKSSVLPSNQLENNSSQLIAKLEQANNFRNRSELQAVTNENGSMEASTSISKIICQNKYIITKDLALDNVTLDKISNQKQTTVDCDLTLPAAQTLKEEPDANNSNQLQTSSCCSSLSNTFFNVLECSTDFVLEKSNDEEFVSKHSAIQYNSAAENTFSIAIKQENQQTSNRKDDKLSKSYRKYEKLSKSYRKDEPFANNSHQLKTSNCYSSLSNNYSNALECSPDIGLEKSDDEEFISNHDATAENTFNIAIKQENQQTSNRKDHADYYDCKLCTDNSNKFGLPRNCPRHVRSCDDQTANNYNLETQESLLPQGFIIHEFKEELKFNAHDLPADSSPMLSAEQMSAKFKAEPNDNIAIQLFDRSKQNISHQLLHAETNTESDFANQNICNELTSLPGIANNECIQAQEDEEWSEESFSNSISIEYNKHYSKLKNNFYCWLCKISKKYANRVGIINHIKASHIAIKYKCTVCNIIHTAYHDMRQHYQNQHKNKQIPLTKDIAIMVLSSSLTAKNSESKIKACHEKTQLEQQQKETPKQNAPNDSNSNIAIKQEQHEFIADEIIAATDFVNDIIKEENQLTEYRFDEQQMSVITEQPDTINGKQITQTFSEKKHCSIAAKENVAAHSNDVEDTTSDIPASRGTVVSSTVLKNNNVSEFDNKLTSLTNNDSSQIENSADDDDVLSEQSDTPELQSPPQKYMNKKQYFSKRIEYNKFYRQLNNKFYCTLCNNNKEYKYHGSVINHIKISHLETNYKCTECNLIYSDYIFMRQHYESQHETKEIPLAREITMMVLSSIPKVVQSTSSGSSRRFNFQTLLHKSDNLYSCNICADSGVSYTNKYSGGVRRHIKSCHETVYLEQKVRQNASSGTVISSSTVVQTVSQINTEHDNELTSLPDAIANAERSIQLQDDELLSNESELLEKMQSKPLKSHIKYQTYSNRIHYNKFYRQVANKFLCTLCETSRKYANRGSIIHHIKFGHLVVKYKCTECSEIYTAYSVMCQHYENHHKTKQMPAAKEIAIIMLPSSSKAEQTSISGSNNFQTLLRKSGNLYLCNICAENGRSYTSKFSEGVRQHIKSCHEKAYLEQQQKMKHIHSVETVPETNSAPYIANDLTSMASIVNKKHLEDKDVNNKLTLKQTTEQQFSSLTVITVSETDTDPDIVNELTSLPDIAKTKQLMLKDKNVNTKSSLKPTEQKFNSKEIFLKQKYNKFYKNVDNKYYCLACKTTQKYHFYSSILNHIQRMHIGIKYKCTECSATKVNYALMLQHYKKHHKTKKIKLLSSSSSNPLSKVNCFQALTRKSGNLHLCNICPNEGKSFTNKYYRIVGDHIKMNHREAFLKQQQKKNKKTFKYSSQRLIQKPDNLYACNTCLQNGIRYTSKNYSTLRFHIKSHHAKACLEEHHQNKKRKTVKCKRNSLQKSSNRYTCNTCSENGITYTAKCYKTMIAHIKACHLEDCLEEQQQKNNNTIAIKQEQQYAEEDLIAENISASTDIINDIIKEEPKLTEYIFDEQQLGLLTEDTTVALSENSCSNHIADYNDANYSVSARFEEHQEYESHTVSKYFIDHSSKEILPAKSHVEMEQYKTSAALPPNNNNEMIKMQGEEKMFAEQKKSRCKKQKVSKTVDNTQRLNYYLCKLCRPSAGELPYNTKYRMNLIRHINKIHNARHKCTDCSKVFATKHSLQRHMHVCCASRKTANNIKVDIICKEIRTDHIVSDNRNADNLLKKTIDKTFDNHKQAKKEVTIGVAVESAKTSPLPYKKVDNLFVCTLCRPLADGKPFIAKSFENMRCHLNKVHFNYYDCTICDKVFVSQFGLERHRLNKYACVAKETKQMEPGKDVAQDNNHNSETSNFTLNCQYCGKVYTTMLYVQRHEKTCLLAEAFPSSDWQLCRNPQKTGGASKRAAATADNNKSFMEVSNITSDLS